MARKINKSHPDLYKYTAKYEFEEGDDTDEAPLMYDTPEEAMKDYYADSAGEVIYVYQLVEVRVSRKPTLYPNYVPETA